MNTGEGIGELGKMTDPAIDSLRAALAVAPGDVALRRMLAERLADRGRIDEAIEEYRAAIKIEPRNRSLRLALGELFSATDRHGAAEVVADELTREDPSLAAAHLLRARALLAQGRPAEARPAYDRAVALDPALANESFAIKLGLAPGEGPREKDVPPPSPPAPIGAPPPSVSRQPPASKRRKAPEPEPNPDGYALVPPVERPPQPRRDEEDEEEEALSPEERRLLERPRITFADVGGMERLKEEIRLKIIYPRQHPELYKVYGKRAGGGILLYGPPGCGKTHLARATAGELGARFISVGIADVLEMWIGSSERNLHRIFEVARTHAPCVLFFDEVDALAASRDDFKGSAGRHVINQFLAEMDGAESSNEGLLVIGATNAPWHMDSAFRRPGRFDNVVFVPPPDVGARVAILQVLLRERPAEGVDLARLAAATEGYSGADLMGLVERAIEAKLAAALREGIPHPLYTEDLLRAAKAAGPTTREWFATVRNYVLYANEGGLYDPVRPYLKGK